MRFRKLAVIVSLFISQFLFAQDFKQASEYLSYIGEEYSRIAKDQWSYTKAVGHGKGSRKIDKRRLEVAQSILEAKRKIARMPPFNRTTKFRDAIVSSMTVRYHVIQEDYAKIVDMEEVAEQSYDQMEAYLLAKKLASEKVQSAHQVVSNQQKIFANENNINLIQSETKLGEKMKEASRVFDYYNEVYLLFFKSYKQEAYLIEAMSRQDINAIEQNKSALLNYSKDSREKLKELTNYHGDQSLYLSSRQCLQFYSEEAENKIPIQMEYFMKKNQFQKIKSAFDQIKTSKRTQADIDKYNNAIAELNIAMEKFNAITTSLNKERSKLLDNWNNKSNAFLDKHIP